MDAQKPVIYLVLEPTTDADQRRLRLGLEKLTEEDPSVRVRVDPYTGRATIAGMGELHLGIIVDRLKREFNVDATVSKPQVAYKETVTHPADGEMKYAKAGGHGQYGHVKIHLYPGQRGSGYVFENKTTVAEIPAEFVRSVEQGFGEALTRGVLGGYPIDDVRVELYDGSHHDVDSSETAFKIAASMALQNAARKAAPVLLEPIMRVEVTAPTERTRLVMKDLLRRRGQLQSVAHEDAAEVVSAHVPLSEMLGYAVDLRELTFGLGTFSMHLDRYEPCRGPDEGGQDPLVRAPRSPVPNLRDSAVALPEPDDDTLET